MIQLMVGLTLQTMELKVPAIEGYAGLKAIVWVAVCGCRDLNRTIVTMMYLRLNVIVKRATEMKRKMRRIEIRLQ